MQTLNAKVKTGRMGIVVLSVILFGVTFGLYWQTRTFDFINYDDLEYIHKSGAVTNGLTWTTFKWAFGPEPCRQMSNWHPVTTLSWMADVSLFGVNPGAMHLHNAFIHSLNGVLLFLFLLMLLGCMKQSGRATVSDRAAARSENVALPDPAARSESVALPRADGTCEAGRAGLSEHAGHVALPILAAFIGAAFWVWHPLRAESVAWVSSRKDVLSILFLLPGLMAYLKTLKGGSKAWLVVSAFCYVLAYCSKPTAVVYPLLAAMLEYVVTRRLSWRQNELLVYLMVVLMAVTFIVQDVGGATVMSLPLRLRVENAIAGLGHYLGVTAWPAKLAIMYKYEVPVPFDRFIGGSLFLIGAFWFFLDGMLPRIKAYWKARHDPQPAGGFAIDPVLLVALGFLWFGFSLAPVIGLIQVGFASCADRYTYLSGIGLSVVLSLGLLVACERVVRYHLRWFPYIIGTISSVMLLFLSVAAYRYISHWKNTQTVFEYAAQSVEGNYIAYCNAGWEPLNKGDYPAAMGYFLESAKHLFSELERKRLSTPYKDMIVTDLAIAFSGTEGDWVVRNEKGVRLTNDVVLSTKVKLEDPLAAQKLFSQGIFSYWRNLDSLALQYFEEALKVAPLDDYLWRFKGYTLDRLGRKEEALAAFRRSLSLKKARDIEQRIKELERSLAIGGGGP